MTRKRFAFVLLVALVFVLAGSQAQAQNNKYKAWVAIAGVAPLSDDTASITGPADLVELTTEVGLDVGFEWRTKWFGLALDFAGSEHEVEVDLQRIGEVGMYPLSLTGNFHLVHTRVIDFYFGPTISYIFWDDIKLDDGSVARTEDSFTYGLSLGLDLSIIKTVAIVIGARYTVEDLEVKPEEVAVNPLMVTVGVAFRWGKRS